MLRRSHKPVVLVVNKVDSFQKYMADVYEFYNLGIGDPVADLCGKPDGDRRYAGRSCYVISLKDAEMERGG